MGKPSKGTPKDMRLKENKKLRGPSKRSPGAASTKKKK
ncbi:hypothetical protein BpsM61_00037 [Bacillus phage vB_BpsM-61]|nr:hypothetical protein BpsM61_00037 [Bacillus phage vB_BpsM-61]